MRQFSFVYRPKTNSSFNSNHFPLNFLTTKQGTPNLEGMYMYKFPCVFLFQLARCIVKMVLYFCYSHQILKKKKTKSGPWDNTIGKGVSANKQQ